MIDYSVFCANCKRLEGRVAAACQKRGRETASVRILPVTKTHPIDAAEYAARYGFGAVGENRVQELSEKFDSPRGRALKIEWELIGHLQTNKVKNAVARASRIQSVDSERLLSKIDAESEKSGKTMRILLQVNAGNDPAKFGADIEEAPALLEAALSKKIFRSKV